MLVTLNGTLVSDSSTRDYVAQVTGNGSGGSSIATGWRLIQIPLGTLQAGTHTLTIGGYNNKKNSSAERTTVLVDDVSVVAP